jgi:hypothetical protein
MSICDLTNPDAQDEEVFRIAAKPINAESMYNFSTFALQINYLTPDLEKKLAITDSRLRPD